MRKRRKVLITLSVILVTFIIVGLISNLFLPPRGGISSENPSSHVSEEVSSSTPSSEPSEVIVSSSSEVVSSLPGAPSSEVIFPETGLEVWTRSDLELMHHYPDEKFILKADIDLTDEAWLPVAVFSGELLGNNHSLIGLHLVEDVVDAGLFAALDGARVAQIVFQEPQFQINIDVSSNEINIGFVAGSTINNPSFIEDITINFGDLSLGGGQEQLVATGGIIGHTKVHTEISNATLFTVNIGAGQISGGLVGIQDGDLLIESSSYEGGINSWTNTGGLVGYVGEDKSLSLTNSEFNGLVYANGRSGGGLVGMVDGGSVNGSLLQNNGTVALIHAGADYSAGGIIGLSLNADLTLHNVINTGSIESSAGRRIGGIIGLLTGTGDVHMEKIMNTGSVLGNYEVGGIIGRLDRYTDFRSIANKGPINAWKRMEVGGDYAGGLFGNTTKGFSVTDAFNSGNVEAHGNMAGGIAGASATPNVSILRTYNNATVKAASYAAGFIGIANDPLSINNALHVGAITSDNVGAILASGGVVDFSDVYYNGIILKHNSVPLGGALYDGTREVLLGELTKAFFIDTLELGEHSWDYSAFDSAAKKYPDLLF